VSSGVDEVTPKTSAAACPDATSALVMSNHNRNVVRSTVKHGSLCCDKEEKCPNS